jgi:hypothetical protein
MEQNRESAPWIYMHIQGATYHAMYKILQSVKLVRFYLNKFYIV